MASFFGKFFGRTIGEAAAFGIGSALREPLEPPLQELTNSTWRAAVAVGATKPLEAGDAADIVAEDVELQTWGTDQAAQTGIGPAQFDALVRATLNAPGLGQLLEILRRHPDDLATFHHGLRKAKLEDSWDKWLLELKIDRLDPATIAAAIQRGIMHDPGYLPVGPPTEEGKVKAFPVSGLDVLAEALRSGIDSDRLFVETALVGNPMGPIEAARAFFRDIIDRVDFDRAIAEGRTRNEWSDAILEEARQITTAHDAVENHLRGYSDAQTMYEQAARHGMSKDDTEVIFQNAGRPLTVHQITTGLARGGRFNPEPGELTDPYEASVHESNIKPAYYDLAIANKYTLPSYFVIRAIIAAGGLTTDEAATIFEQEGWPPDLAAKAAKALTPAKATTVDPLVKSQQTKLLTTVHNGYVKEGATVSSALLALQPLGYPQTTIDQIIAVWDIEKAFLQAQATVPPGPIT